MSQNSEQIEAKLCAYLEGELDESGRAEIEKHLQQNPAHRKLLAEVGKTRDLLRGLPREPAPADICEAFQGQLERSVLLADLDDEGGTSSMKINRWPQYMAVAAVVMLAAGLGMVVYFGLPSGVPDRNVAISSGGGPAGTPGVIEDGATTRSMAQATGTVPAKPATLTDTLATKKDADSLGESNSPEQLAKKVEQLPSPAMQPPAATAPTTNEELTVLARRVQGSWDPRERQRLFTANAATDAEGTLKALENIPATAMCYVVTAADAGAASDKIGQELSRMQVAWSVVPRPDPAALQTSLAAIVPEADVAPVAVLRQSVDKPIEERTEPAAPAPQRPAAAPADESVALRGRGMDTDASRVGRAKQDVAAGAAVSGPLGTTRGPVTQPAQEFAASAEKETVLADRAAKPESRGYASRADLSGRAESLIIARNLTRQQADALRTSLGTQAVEQQVKMYARLAPTSKAKSEAKTQVAQGVETDAYRQLSASGGAGGGAGEKSAVSGSAGDAVIRQGDALRVVMARDLGEQTVTEVQVGQNGFAKIPGVGDFRCEGLTVAQLHTRLSTSSAAGAADGIAKLVQVTKVEKAKDAPGAAPAEMDAVAAVTEQDVAQRGARRARNDVMLRQGMGGAPARAERGAGQESFAAGRPAPAPASAPAPTAAAAPAEPSSRFAEARGGAAGMGGAAPAQQTSPQAAGVAAPTDVVGQHAQTREARGDTSGATQLTTAPVSGDERIDVVIVVRADTPAEALADASAEPAGPIEKFEILTVQLGDGEADSANVRVGDDGTIELPKVGRVKAEGLTAAGLGEQIAAKLRDNADAAPAEVKVKRFGNSDAAAAPAPEGDRQQQQPAAKEPATGPSETPEPAKGEPGPAPAGGQPRD